MQDWLNKTVDAVEVVRCKDCRHYRYHGYLKKPQDKVYCYEYGFFNYRRRNKNSDVFCSYGERRDARAARKLGLSYGKYIALYKPKQPPAERFPKKAAKDSAEVHCELCGKLIPAAIKGRKYCGPECADEARRQQRIVSAKKAKEAQPPKEKPQITCIRCGKPIPAHAKRRKYCSAECADAALAEQLKKHKLQK